MFTRITLSGAPALLKTSSFTGQCLPKFARSSPRQKLFFVAMAASPETYSEGKYRYIILGGGNAAGYAAAEFVKRGVKKGELAIISSEKVPSYERPTLSKAYLFPEGAPRLPGFNTCAGGGGEKQELDWYEKHGIDFILGTTVDKADLSKKTLSAGLDTFKYEKLIIAIGCVMISLAKDFKTPGADLDNIMSLRDVADADKLLSKVKSAKKAVVVGGGYIGMEVGSNLIKHGLETTIVYPEPTLMARLFTPEIADFYAKIYTEKGVKLRPESLATAFEGKDGKVTHVVLKSGEKIEADLVVSGVGARPELGLFKGQLDLLEDKPGGIKVDSKFQTSNPDVYAIGDISAFPLPRYNQTTRQEHVTHARTSAAHAVSAIYAPSETKDYDYLPFFYSRIFDLSWQFYGNNAPDDKVVFFGDKGAKHFGSYWIRDGKVVGAFSEGGSAEENAGLKKVADKQPSAPADLAEQGFAFASKL